LFSAAVDQAFRAESFGFSEVGAGVRFRGRIFSEALDCAWEGPRPDSAGTTADQRERFLLRLSALSWLYPMFISFGTIAIIAVIVLVVLVLRRR
jgi:hypothetical protein